MNKETRENLLNNLLEQESCPDLPHEIIIITHNRHDLLDKCLESIENSSKSKVLIWDNNSTPKILNSTIYSEINEGFIIPNNRLIKMVTTPYVILLNSDVVVYPGWEKALLAPLLNPKIGIVGFHGQKLDKNGLGFGRFSGKNIDFVSGWAIALRTKQAIRFGPFDETYKFASFEDSDLCLRIKSTGLEVKALEIVLADHLGSGTFSVLKNQTKILSTISRNQEIFKQRWCGILSELNCGTQKK